jgi:hypothetical protein
MSTSYRNGRCTILDEGSGVSWVYDFRRNIWQGTEYVETVEEQPVILFDRGPHQLFGPRAPLVNGLLAWRLVPNGARTKDFEPLPEVFEAWTSEMWLGGPQTKITPRYLFLKLRQRTGDAFNADLEITPFFDNVEGEPLTIQPINDDKAFWVRKSIGQKRRVSSIQLRFKQELAGTEDSLFDIEQGIIGYNVERVA